MLSKYKLKYNVYILTKKDLIAISGTILYIYFIKFIMIYFKFIFIIVPIMIYTYIGFIIKFIIKITSYKIK